MYESQSEGAVCSVMLRLSNVGMRSCAPQRTDSSGVQHKVDVRFMKVFV